MPMFPLGTVLVPYLVMPLHVFEERYRTMTKDCMAGDREFGVVLIERGFEVGGGDDRFSVGTVARIVQADELPDGRWALLTVGSRRIHVEEWLPEDPYPRAMVTELEGAPVGPEHAGALAAAERVVRRALALKTELGEGAAAPATFELAGDPDVASWQLSAFAPIGPVDRLRILAAADPDERLAVLTAVAEEACALLEFRLGD